LLSSEFNFQSRWQLKDEIATLRGVEMNFCRFVNDSRHPPLVQHVHFVQKSSSGVATLPDRYPSDADPSGMIPPNDQNIEMLLF
jgi:hypothetical protein